MIDKLILGTAQLGFDYGINNSLGKPSLQVANKILETAYSNGIELIDTAESYGESHKIIGNFLREHPEISFSIISKLSISSKIHKGDLIRHIENNLRTLNVDSLLGYMFHSCPSFESSRHIYGELNEAKEMGLFKKLGVSLYTNEEIEAICEYHSFIDFIQIPFNLLDNELRRKKSIDLARKKGIEVHTRSAFLQGLLFKQKNQLPSPLIPLKPYLDELIQIQRACGLRIEELALQYPLQKKYISKVLIGVESVEQLERNIKTCKQTIQLPLNRIDQIDVREEKLLNPSNWNTWAK